MSAKGERGTTTKKCIYFLSILKCKTEYAKIFSDLFFSAQSDFFFKIIQFMPFQNHKYGYNKNKTSIICPLIARRGRVPGLRTFFL